MRHNRTPSVADRDEINAAAAAARYRRMMRPGADDDRARTGVT